MVESTLVVLSAVGATLDEVERYGRRLGRALRPGDLVLLEGPLGAGKTTFVRAVAGSLEVTDPVRSPSFTLANIYAGRYVVQHLDLYRLDEIGDEDALALEEYSTAEAVTLVEWPEAGEGILGEPTWWVRLGHETSSTRSLEIVAAGEQTRKRWEEAGSDE